MTGSRRLAALLAVALASGALAGVTPTSTAFFVDTVTSTGSTTTATLDPPTALAASAVGATVTLTWSASPDAAVADGYQVLRASARGRPLHAGRRRHAGHRDDHDRHRALERHLVLHATDVCGRGTVDQHRDE